MSKLPDMDFNALERTERTLAQYHRKAAELLDEMIELGVQCPVEMRKRYLSLRTQIQMLHEQHDHITGRKYPA